MTKPNLIAVHVIRYHFDQPEYLLIRRACNYLKGTWQMVTGKIENNEKAYEAAIRELEEEIGLTPTDFYSADFTESFYFAPKDCIHFVIHFVAFVSGKDPITLSPTEHDQYEWMPREKALQHLCFSSQKVALQQIHDNFVNKQPLTCLRIT